MLKKFLCLPKKPFPNYPKTETIEFISESTLVKNSAGLLGLKTPAPGQQRCTSDQPASRLLSAHKSNRQKCSYT